MESIGNNTCGILQLPLLDLTKRSAVAGKLLALMALGNPDFLTAQMEACVTGELREVTEGLDAVAIAQAKYRSADFADMAMRVAEEIGVAAKRTRTVHERIVRPDAGAVDFDRQWTFVRELLRCLSEEIREVRLAGCGSAVQQCCEYIDRNVFGRISLEELGRICGHSPHYVSDLFRKELGIGALQYAHQIRMQHGKFLVEHSQLGIAEIAKMLSYPSHSNFSQRFKKIYGVTPQEYRLACIN